MDKDGQTDGNVFIRGYVLEVVGAEMVGALMAGAASAQVWIHGSKTDLWYQLSRILANFDKVV